MSVTKTQPTEFSTEDAPVKYTLTQLNIQSIHKKANVSLHCVLRGCIDGTDGEVAKYTTNLNIDDILDGFSAAEKTATKKFLAAVEREAVKKVEDLAAETHDDTDVFA